MPKRAKELATLHQERPHTHSCDLLSSSYYTITYASLTGKACCAAELLFREDAATELTASAPPGKAATFSSAPEDTSQL